MSRDPFNPHRRLEDLSREALARLGREYMLFGHIRDRGIMPVVAIRFGIQSVEDIAIDEWMGASPLYTRRMRRAMGIAGDSVASIMKSLQLDVGFPHRYMDVGYEVESDRVGYFWLNCCRALVDAEPFGEKAVLSMCHAIEDPTFDATAYAVNPRARMRPIHRPPRNPADRVPHCRWEIRIDPTNDPAPEPAITRLVRACRLTDFALDPVDVEDGDGRPDYSGDFDPHFRLDDLSRRALVIACKELSLQNQLLGRSSMLAMTQRFGAAAAREAIAAQWLSIAPLSTRRICEAMGIEGGDAAAILRMLQLHPIFPRDYTRLGFELVDADRGRFWLEDCAALDDEEPRGFLSFLEDPNCPGLDAMVQAVNPRARCRLIPAPNENARLAWEVTVDERAVAATEPEEARMLDHSTVTGFRFEEA
jgi:hypothetical protein